MKSKDVGQNLLKFLDQQFKLYLRQGHHVAVVATYNVKTILLNKKMKSGGDSKLIEALNYCIYDAQRTLDRLATNTVELESKAVRTHQLNAQIEIYKELKEKFKETNI